MTDMQSRTITLLADDKIVAVDGEAYKVAIGMPADLHAMRWLPQAAEKVRGYIERKVGDSHHFQDFANLAPYLKAWEIAKADADAAGKRARDAAEEARRSVELANARAHEESQRKRRENAIALQAEQAAKAEKLAGEINARAADSIKAMEAEAAERRAAVDKQAALTGALAMLADSDHEIIKAMEAQLTAVSALPSDLVAKRRVAREMVKAERKKLVQ